MPRRRRIRLPLPRRLVLTRTGRGGQDGYDDGSALALPYRIHAIRSNQKGRSSVPVAATGSRTSGSANPA